MASSLIRVHWDDLTEATPAFITAAMMPFTYSITEGIAFGFISYCVMKAVQVEYARSMPQCGWCLYYLWPSSFGLADFIKA